MPSDWNGFDVAMLVVLVLSMAVGVWRGLVLSLIHI